MNRSGGSWFLRKALILSPQLGALSVLKIPPFLHDPHDQPDDNQTWNSQNIVW